MKGMAAASVLALVTGLTALDSVGAEPVEQQATAMLFDACPTLATARNASEIVDLKTSRLPAEDSSERDMGWREIVQVQIKLASPAKSLPRDFYASGHTCQFDIGHGGLMTAKAPCKKICGITAIDRDPAYLPIAATKALNLAAE
ncbi:hypothetical protein [Pseudomonas fluorescens]|uniref:hypothetical protein n=1 Tax=Pseudomonas fluorescens TaxID=294 RepID=UPI0007D0701E|nr:hypothetical protein [Pseudomonas fluorescens]